MLNGVLTAAGLLLPLVLACAIILAMMPHRDASVAKAAPNPEPAPWYFLAPTEYLVYFNPRIAGVMVLWYWLWFGLGGAFVGSAVLIFPSIKSPFLGSRVGLFLVSLTVGFVAALPWWYCIAVRLAG